MHFYFQEAERAAIAYKVALLHEAKEKKEKEAAEKEKRKNARMKVRKSFRGDNFFFPIIVFHTYEYSFRSSFFFSQTNFEFVLTALGGSRRVVKADYGSG